MPMYAFNFHNLRIQIYVPMIKIDLVYSGSMGKYQTFERNYRGQLNEKWPPSLEKYC